jgi:hypothetical protein
MRCSTPQCIAETECVAKTVGGHDVSEESARARVIVLASAWNSVCLGWSSWLDHLRRPLTKDGSLPHLRMSAVRAMANHGGHSADRNTALVYRSLRFSSESCSFRNWRI